MIKDSCVRCLRIWGVPWRFLVTREYFMRDEDTSGGMTNLSGTVKF